MAAQWFVAPCSRFGGLAGALASAPAILFAMSLASSPAPSLPSVDCVWAKTSTNAKPNAKSPLLACLLPPQPASLASWKKLAQTKHVASSLVLLRPSRWCLMSRTSAERNTLYDNDDENNNTNHSLLLDTAFAAK